MADDTESLIHNEEDYSEPADESASQSSNYSQDHELCEFSHRKTDTPYTECQNSFPELTKCCEDTAYGYNRDSEQLESNNFSFNFLREKFETVNDPEMLLPIQDRGLNLHPDEKQPFGHVKCWNLQLRCGHVPGIKLPYNGKVWRPVLVKLEEGIIEFHAADVEMSPPFKVVHLTWFNSFRIPVKTRLIRGECLFTTKLVNALHATHDGLGKYGICWKTNGGKEMKVGCTNYSVLLDFIDTVHMCIANFPGFRRQGIRYKTEKALIRVQNAYIVTQKEKESVTVQQVRIMMKAKVSACPECSVRVKLADSFSKKPTLDKVSFHKCVRSRCLVNQTVTSRFLPLDNCWFQLMSWDSSCSRPSPLRCEVTVKLCGYDSIQLRARIFTGSTNLDVSSASDVLLRFYIPLEWLEREKKSAVQTIHQCTNVTKGNVSYNTNPETMLWSIPKLSFQPCRNFYLTGKPVASLTIQLKPSSRCNSQEIVKVPVEMTFFAKGNARSSEVDITSMKVGLKSFEKFKSSYSSAYRVIIPVTLSVS